MDFKPYFEQYYEVLKNMYVDQVQDFGQFKLVRSEIIDDGIWNFVYGLEAKDYKDLVNLFNRTKPLFVSRTPRLYVLDGDQSAKYVQKLKKDYAIYCEDSWFLTRLCDLDLSHKARLDVHVEVCKNKSEIIDCIMDGFSTHDPNDPYGDLSPTYRESLEQKLMARGIKYPPIHYAARHQGRVVSLASVTIAGENAYLNNVTTLKEFKGKAISKEVLTFAIADLNEHGVENIIFATEKGAYTEDYYKKLGFKPVATGYCFEEK